jgi:hypothetical protein
MTNGMYTMKDVEGARELIIRSQRAEEGHITLPIKIEACE